MKRIKAGDTVIVISGDDKGQKGKVLSVIGERAIVEGLNMMKKFVKKNVMGKNQAGTMVDVEIAMHLSNLQPVDPKTGKGTKVTYSRKDGKKNRVARKSGEIIVALAVESEKPVKAVKAPKTEKTEVIVEPEKVVAKKATTSKVVKSKAKKNETT